MFENSELKLHSSLLRIVLPHIRFKVIISKSRL